MHLKLKKPGGKAATKKEHIDDAMVVDDDDDKAVDNEDQDVVMRDEQATSIAAPKRKRTPAPASRLATPQKPSTSSSLSSRDRSGSVASPPPKRAKAVPLIEPSPSTTPPRRRSAGPVAPSPPRPMLVPSRAELSRLKTISEGVQGDEEDIDNDSQNEDRRSEKIDDDDDKEQPGKTDGEEDISSSDNDGRKFDDEEKREMEDDPSAADDGPRFDAFNEPVDRPVTRDKPSFPSVGRVLVPSSTQGTTEPVATQDSDRMLEDDDEYGQSGKIDWLANKASQMAMPSSTQRDDPDDFSVDSSQPLPETQLLSSPIGMFPEEPLDARGNAGECISHMIVLCHDTSIEPMMHDYIIGSMLYFRYMHCARILRLHAGFPAFAGVALALHRPVGQSASLADVASAHGRSAS